MTETTAPTETVIITKAEYEDLHSSAEFLECLEAAGVNNWPGYVAVLKAWEDEVVETPKPA